MIKKIRKAVVLIMAFLSIGACSMLNRETSSEVEKRLEEKYGEKFTAMTIGDRLDTKHAKLYLHPEGNEDVLFTAQLEQDGTLTDDYLIQIRLTELEQKIRDAVSEKGMKCEVNAVAAGSVINEDDPALGLKEILEKNGIGETLVKLMLLDGDFSAGDLKEALENAADGYGINLIFLTYILDEAGLEKCRELTAQYPSVSTTLLEKNNPRVQFYVNLENGVCVESSEELAERMGK